MNVLADRHHAGLFYSLQLLGDRLGWTVYTPVGRDWWDQGYWRFGEVYGDERLVDQYLDPAGTAWAKGGHDQDYPDRPIAGVTLEQARAMDWTFVIATVQENQPGFARFAREVGARYVYQVGNTRQRVDWSLWPLVIASSEVPLQSGVRYHQEMHSCFAWRPPTDRHRISSFVNLMPRIDCWPTLWETARALTDFDFRVHGAGCPDGTIHPTTAVADAMAASGWGWHDKVTGDGFGHVLWGWAAIGRPIIGHAHHYAGQLGEVLWTPETSIDLDRYTPTEAAALIRTISADADRHAEMCAAMRRTFEAHYNPERDAQAIREFLA